MDRWIRRTGTARDRSIRWATTRRHARPSVSRAVVKLSGAPSTYYSRILSRGRRSGDHFTARCGHNGMPTRRACTTGVVCYFNRRFSRASRTGTFCSAARVLDADCAIFLSPNRTGRRIGARRGRCRVSARPYAATFARASPRSDSESLSPWRNSARRMRTRNTDPPDRLCDAEFRENEPETSRSGFTSVLRSSTAISRG